MIKKKIIIITVARADYGHLRPLIKKLNKNPKFNCLLYATGLHLLKEHGYTLKEIIKDKFKIDRIIDIKIKPKSTPYNMAYSVGYGIEKFSNAFKKDKPDMIIVMGDRIEVFAVASAASLMNIPVVHIGGGDTAYSDIDNTLRHSITKLSHIHFTHSKKSTETVLKLGEEKWRVHWVGVLSLDTILKIEFIPKKKLLSEFKFPYKNYLLVVFHPTTTDKWEESGFRMEQLMEACLAVVKNKNMGILVIYPNAYAGGAKIIKVINKYKRANKNIYTLKNLPHEKYISLLKYSSVLVGNSSSGIVEAASLKVPVVNIGDRQKFRETPQNVIRISYKKELIEKAIKKALCDKGFQKRVKLARSPYGDGRASERIVRILNKIKINKDLLSKKFIQV